MDFGWVVRLSAYDIGFLLKKAFIKKVKNFAQLLYF